MVIRYSDKSQIRSGPQTTDVWARFPSNAQPMASAPVSGSHPIKLFEANGRTRWGLRPSVCSGPAFAAAACLRSIPQPLPHLTGALGGAHKTRH